MDQRPDNLFRFRRLKWGAPKRLRGAATLPPVGGGGDGRRWLALVAGVIVVAVGMRLLGWF